MTTLPPANSAGRILVVDDRRENRELLAQELEDEDFEVRTAASGPECLQIARQWAPEVILLDINMPGMDGIETCRRLQASTETAQASVLFVTALRTDDESTVEALSAGGNDFLTKPYSLPILLARVNCQLQICRAHSRLRQVAMTDELTGVFTRRFLFDSLRKVVKGASRRQTAGLACLLADVDHFKRVNDRLGHLEGDRVLRAVAQTIRSATRETDVVARFGGEEFVVVLPHTEAEGAQVVAEKIRRTIEIDCAPVTISIGVAAAQGNCLSDAHDGTVVDELIEHLLRRADAALYDAKRQGRNRVVLAPPPGAASADAATPSSSDEAVAPAAADRRGSQRLGIPVQVRLLNLAGQPLVQTANLSTGGIALADAPPLADGQALEMELELDGTTITVTGTVVWAGVVVGTGRRCGVAFDELSAALRSKLSAFVAAKLGQGAGASLAPE